MSGVTQEDLHAWCVERFGEVLEEGGLSLVGAVRYSASGGEVPLMSMTSKMDTAKWNADNVAATLGAICDRDARGLPGVTQFQLIACYGSNPKPVRFLPFQRVGQLQHGPLPNGGLGTESPTPTGVMQVGMRWGELAIQGAGRKEEQIINLIAALLKDERENNRRLNEDNRALSSALLTVAGAAQDRKLQMLESYRKTEMGREMIRLAPPLINGVTGRSVFPESSVGNSLIERLAKKAESMTPAQFEQLTALLADDDPNFALALLGRFEELRQIEHTRHAELRRQMAEAEKNPLNVDAAIAEGAGDLWRGPSSAGSPAPAIAHAEPQRLRAPPDGAAMAIDMRRPHNVTKTEARTFVEGVAAGLEQVGARWAWDGADRMLFEAAEGSPAKGVSGVIDVSDSELRFRVSLPGLTRMLKTKIEATIEEHLKARLPNNATNGGT
jgi:hypothetical protein